MAESTEVSKRAALDGKWTLREDGLWSCLKSFYAQENNRIILVPGPIPDKDGKMLDGTTRTLDEAYALEVLRSG